MSDKTPPILERTLRPHVSLTQNGATWVFIALAIGLAIPLLPFAGTPVGWGLLPFAAGALVMLGLFVTRNLHDRDITEHVRLWPDRIEVERKDRKSIRHWDANPYWVELCLKDSPKIEKYLTLRGNGREIELGAFLTPDERVNLYHDLDTALRTLR